MEPNLSGSKRMFVGPSGLLKWHCFETMAGSSPQLRATEFEFRRGMWLCLADLSTMDQNRAAPLAMFVGPSCLLKIVRLSVHACRCSGIQNANLALVWDCGFSLHHMDALSPHEVRRLWREVINTINIVRQKGSYRPLCSLRRPPLENSSSPS
jgi:hypothetical protein